jgi:TonB family protein
MRHLGLLSAFAAAAIISALPLGVCAQSADLPSAPAPAAPSKPDFRLPAGMVVIAQPKGPPPPAPEEEMVCYAAADGIYAKVKAWPPAQKEAISRDMSTAIHQLEIEWDRHMPRTASDPWVKGKVVTVRFAIMPDGSVDTPIVTVPSGRKSYDKHALDAVDAVAPFPPLPVGVTRPLPVCMRFGYNVDPSARKPEPIDLWPPKPEVSKAPAAVDGAGPGIK